MSLKKVRLNFYTTRKQRKILKAIATETNSSLTAIAVEALDRYLKEYLENPDLPDLLKTQLSAYFVDDE